MLRKLSDRLATAASAVAASAGLSDTRVTALTSLGFDDASARRALQACDGDVDRAAELLLASGTASTVGAGTFTSPITINDEDDARVLQQVIDESRGTSPRSTTLSGNPTANRSAASMRAGQAAAARARSTAVTVKPSSLATTHPKVSVLPKLQDKPTEEQILRCADRLKTFPSAVDTLHRAISLIQANPDESKYRKINKSLASYQRTLANATGAEDFLKAMQFRPQGGAFLVLERPLVDPALLYLGTSALEQTKLTTEYKKAKQLIVFNEDVKRILLAADASVSEAVARANYLSKCPAEPADGRGALMTVQIADQTLRRRFDGDDTLADVIHWLGGHSSIIPEKLVSREWSLVDKNKYPLRPLGCSESLQRHTLQYIGCWPSGLLEILPSKEEWNSTDMTAMDSDERPSRGLGTFSH